MPKAYLEITLNIDEGDRASAGAVYAKFKDPFLKTIAGAKSKELLLRAEDVQVLHGFDTQAAAQDYLSSTLFNKDVVTELAPYLKSDPDIRIYALP